LQQGDGDWYEGHGILGTSLNHARLSLPKGTIPAEPSGVRFDLRSLRVTGKNTAKNGKSDSERRTFREGLEEYGSKAESYLSVAQ